MASKATEATKARMPQQFVREGRGVAGYKGNVETYDPRPQPAATKRISGKKSKSPSEDK